LALPVVIENHLAISRGIELPPVMPPDVSSEPFGFGVRAEEPENELVTLVESAWGPGPRTRLVMATAERISHEADVEYFGTPADGDGPMRVKVTFEWEEFPPEAPYDRRIERTTWVVCVAADEGQCGVVASNAEC